MKSGCIVESLKAVGIMVVMVIFIGMGWLVWKGMNHSGDLDGLLAARSWARRSLADPDAEIVGVTAPQTMGGVAYRACSVRGKNRFGGPVSSIFILRMTDEGKVMLEYTPEAFRLVLDGKLQKLLPEDKAKLEKEYEAMCLTFGVPAERASR